MIKISATIIGQVKLFSNALLGKDLFAILFIERNSYKSPRNSYKSPPCRLYKYKANIAPKYKRTIDPIKAVPIGEDTLLNN